MPSKCNSLWKRRLVYIAFAALRFSTGHADGCSALGMRVFCATHSPRLVSSPAPLEVDGGGGGGYVHNMCSTAPTNPCIAAWSETNRPLTQTAQDAFDNRVRAVNSRQHSAQVWFALQWLQGKSGMRAWGHEVPVSSNPDILALWGGHNFSGPDLHRGGMYIVRLRFSGLQLPGVCHGLAVTEALHCSAVQNISPAMQCNARYRPCDAMAPRCFARPCCPPMLRGQVHCQSPILRLKERLHPDCHP